MEQRYNVFFAGQILDEHELSNVKEKLARVFKADQQTLEKLFSGKAQMVKRDCDKATAMQYKAAMEGAGALPIIKAVVAARLSAAEKIAALADAPDENPFAEASGETSGTDAVTARSNNSASAGTLDIAPAGTDVLREDERAVQITRDVDTSGIEIDVAAQRLSPEPPPPPAAPDTSHLDLDEVGATLPNLPPGRHPLSPNTDAIALAPDGGDFSDCAAPPAPEPALDFSGMAVAPTGAELMEKKYRRQEQPAAPSTEHLSLEK